MIIQIIVADRLTIGDVSVSIAKRNDSPSSARIDLIPTGYDEPDFDSQVYYYPGVFYHCSYLHHTPMLIIGNVTCITMDHSKTSIKSRYILNRSTRCSTS